MWRRFIIGLVFESHLGGMNQSQNKPAFCCAGIQGVEAQSIFLSFLLFSYCIFLISLHCFVTSVALSFPVAVLATLTHTVLQSHTDLSCFCSTGNTHTAWYLLCPQKLMWKLHSISQRAELYPSSPYIGLCLFSDHINFTCLSRFFSEIPCFSLVIS